MKLSFLLPKDKIKLLKSGTLAHTLETSKQYAYQFEDVKKSGLTEIPKGSILTVSQIYLRNRGWFENGITFKLNTDPKNTLYEGMLKARIAQEVKYRKDQLDHQQRKLALLNDGNHSVVIQKIGRFDGTESPIERTWTYDTPITSVEQGNAFYNENCRGQSGTYNICIRPEVNDVIERLNSEIDSLTNRTKGTFGSVLNSFRNSVIRVRLPDIEQWDVKIVEKSVDKPMRL